MTIITYHLVVILYNKLKIEKHWFIERSSCFCYCRNLNFLWSHCKNLWLMICNFLLILADAWWQFFVSTKPALHLPQWTISKSISWKIVNFRHTKWNIEAFLLIKVNHKILHVFYDLLSIFKCRRFGSF
jgi:hypothetical protein